MTVPEVPPQGTGRTEQPQATLFQLLEGYLVARSLHIAVQLGVADALREGPKGTAELAVTVGAHPDALYRLLRALASAGVFTEVAPSRFALTPVGDYLRSDVAGSMHALALYYASNMFLRTSDGLLESVRTGAPTFEKTFGMPRFSYLSGHPEDAATYNTAMTAISEMSNAAILAAYDFSSVRTLVDVVGGQGSLLIAILGAHPSLRGVLFDRPQVVEGWQPSIQATELADRCEVVGGDYFNGVPDGADCYVIKNVFVDHDDGEVTEVLQHCRRAMARGGRVVIIEPVIPPGDEPSPNKFMDLHFLMHYPGARARTEKEHRALLQGAGFRCTRVLPTASQWSVLEAVASEEH